MLGRSVIDGTLLCTAGKKGHLSKHVKVQWITVTHVTDYSVVVLETKLRDLPSFSERIVVGVFLVYTGKL
jgi:hypothetical protein